MTTASTDDFGWLPLRWRPGLSLRRAPDGTVLGRFYGAELSSVYQAVVDAGSGRRVGREAFVRSHANGDLSLSPWSLFSLVADDEVLVGLDRLCRTLHVLNDPLAHDPAAADELLFLNVHGRLLAAVSEDHGHAFRRILDLLGRKASTGFVIETPEAACAEPRLLAFVLANYRLNGFKVAANVRSLADLSALLAELRPNFVKVDVRHLRAEEIAPFAELALRHAARPVFTHVERAAHREALAGVEGAWAQGFAYPEVQVPAAPAAVERGRGQLAA